MRLQLGNIWISVHGSATACRVPVARPDLHPAQGPGAQRRARLAGAAAPRQRGQPAAGADRPGSDGRWPPARRRSSARRCAPGSTAARTARRSRCCAGSAALQSRSSFSLPHPM